MAWFGKKETKQQEETAPAFDERAALDDPEYVKELARYIDSPVRGSKKGKEIDWTKPEDVKEAAGLKENMERKAETTDQLKEVYTKELQERLGLDLPPGAFDDVEAHLVELQRNNPGELKKLLGNIEEYNKFKEEIAQLQGELDKDLGFLREKEALLDKAHETGPRKWKIFGADFTQGAHKARFQLKEQFGIELDQIQTSLDDVRGEISSVDAAMNKREEIMGRFKGLRAELLKTMKGSETVFKKADEALTDKFTELTQPGKDLNSLREAQDLLDKVDGRTEQEKASEHFVGKNFDAAKRGDLNKRIQSQLETDLIEGMKNLPPESRRISEVEEAFKTLLKMEENKQFKVGSLKGQKAKQWVGGVMKKIIDPKTGVSPEGRLLVKRVVDTYGFPVK